MNCYIGLWSPDHRELKTVPADDRRSLTALRSRGWIVVRIFRANLPWPASQWLTCCMTGHR